MLEIKGLEAGYGETRVLHGVDLSIARGTFHAVLGRNGAGKSTLLKTIVGLLPPSAGEIRFAGQSIAGQSIAAIEAFRIARRGIAYVPETRDVFGALSVRENLALAARLAYARGPWNTERVFRLFPQLARRADNGGSQLSGGEQQILAIARALVMNPRLLILDEPTEGLAPILVGEIFERLGDLRGDGMTMVLVEQNLPFAARLADTASILGRGRCVWSGPAAQLSADAKLQERWLGI
ncbi:ABC transporter ATP-binding protein [Pseudohoeflea sp. DP4N28-3]|uniref:ABC transporter ATP-binding protein n=1 Tax=Pseudohoeflea coraliihabitans TaxID=2860393 RepID=A0ABS6WS95_9HYPH|nr:ABC transporter ATP-binding protein [Pseudohoeflea sp. DP4N28-3]